MVLSFCFLEKSRFSYKRGSRCFLLRKKI